MKMLKRTPCPRCDAKTVRQAERMCMPHAIADTGDYDCTTAERHDRQGWLLGPTPEAQAAEDAYWEAMGRRQDARIELDHQTLAHDRRMPTPPFWHPQAGRLDDYARLPGVAI